jgi:hypothetical protein
VTATIASPAGSIGRDWRAARSTGTADGDARLALLIVNSLLIYG